MKAVQGDFLMTYDNDAYVQALADRHGLETRPIAMKSSHHAEMTELLIGRNLGKIVITDHSGAQKKWLC